MSVLEGVLESPGGRRTISGLVALGAGLLAFGLGVVLAAVAYQVSPDASPLVFIAIPLAPLVALAVLVAPAVAAIAVFLTFPIGADQVPTGVIPLQTVELAVLAIVAVVVVRRLARGQMPLPWQPPLYWALGLLVWTIVALQSAIDNTLALKQVGSLFGGIIFAASILAACRNMDDLRVILGAFVAVCGGIALASFVGGVQLHAVYGAQAVSGRLQGAFDHPNQLGALCSLGIAVGIGLTFGAKRRWARLGSFAASAVMFVALLFTLSRGAWIGTALALIFLLFALSEARRAVALLIVPGILVATIVAPLAPVGTTEVKVVGQRAQALTALSPYDNRRQIYAEAWREIKENPLTGVGPGGFQVASARAGSLTSTYAVVHAHNLLLTWGAECGIPAMIMIVAFAISLAMSEREAGRRFRRLGRTRDRAIAAGLGAALLAIVGQGLFDYVFRNAVANVALWGTIGALLVCLREARRAELD
ncbi:MAG TPA: O-antigen ligase family protein [Gaiellaceae bacterium]|nr:O-antigen ligase family protein [Gaiellaceae bacterium]